MEKDAMARITDTPRCCGTCWYRENGTGCCICPRGKYKLQYMAPKEVCDDWKERRKPNA